MEESKFFSRNLETKLFHAPLKKLRSSEQEFSDIESSEVVKATSTRPNIESRSTELLLRQSQILMCSKRSSYSPKELKSAESSSEIKRSLLPEEESLRLLWSTEESSRAASESENQSVEVYLDNGQQTLIDSRILRLRLLFFKERSTEERSSS